VWQHAGCPTLSLDFGEGWESPLNGNPILSRTERETRVEKPDEGATAKGWAAHHRCVEYAPERHSWRYKMSNDPLANLGDLTKPATVLIEKISEAVGGVFKPYQIVRVAKAEAEAELIHAKAQIQVTDLQRRAMHRFLLEEAKKQSNIESITAKALRLLEAKSSPQDVEDDWITNFFEKSRIVSDIDMQKLWAHVLAGEANVPGSFSKRTVNLLSDLDKRDADLFTNLCGFVWIIRNTTQLVFDVGLDIYNRFKLHFNFIKPSADSRANPVREPRRIYSARTTEKNDRFLLRKAT
jgi:hypothetical protein